MDDSSEKKSKERLARRLGHLSSTLVSDALDRLGIEGAARGLHPLLPVVPALSRAVGAVVTVSLRPAGSTPPPHHLGSKAIEAADERSVIVVAGADRSDIASWGGLLSRAASARRIAGVVIDGACRDVDEIRSVGLPVFARGVTPVTARGRVAERATNVPVRVCGVLVRPEDLVLADGSGVVFIPRHRAADVLGLAETLSDRERVLALELDNGRSPVDVLAGGYEGLTRNGS